MHNTHHVGPNGHRGFSLVELLVVIAIISVLVALTLPQISRAREVGRRAVCAGNLRQMFLGYTNYAASNKGYYPGIVGHGQGIMGDAGYARNGANDIEWARSANKVMTEYVDKAITICPSAYPAFSQKKWSLYDQGGPTEFPYGEVDYSLKAGFASSHTFHVNGVRVIDQDLSDAVTPRGVMQGRFKHDTKGFFFNFREENQHMLNPGKYKEQSGYSLMFVDRARSPVLTNDDINHTGSEQSSNHSLNGSLAAEGANACLKNGAVRWMKLSDLWSSTMATEVNHPQAYGVTGFAEGQVVTYVDEYVAEHF